MANELYSWLKEKKVSQAQLDAYLELMDGDVDKLVNDFQGVETLAENLPHPGKILGQVKHAGMFIGMPVPSEGSKSEFGTGIEESLSARSDREKYDLLLKEAREYASKYSAFASKLSDSPLGGRIGGMMVQIAKEPKLVYRDQL